jgi:hypothetical protein
MKPELRTAGIAGIFSGILLIVEFALFMTSGVQPSTLQNATVALPFLQDHGANIRMAVLFGAINAALAIVLVTGFAARLHVATPTGAVATLYFGILGTAGHGLVALTYWLGIPVFVALMQGDQESAAYAWPAFFAVIGGFNDFGDFFIGLSLLTAGWAIVSKKALPVLLGWVALVGGVATIARLLGLEMAFFASLPLAIIIRIWMGIALLKRETSEARFTSGGVQVQANL